MESGFLKPVQVAALKEQPNVANMTQHNVISLLNSALPQKAVSAKVVLSEKKLDKYFPSHYSTRQREEISERGTDAIKCQRLLDTNENQK